MAKRFDTVSGAEVPADEIEVTIDPTETMIEAGAKYLEFENARSFRTIAAEVYRVMECARRAEPPIKTSDTADRLCSVCGKPEADARRLVNRPWQPAAPEGYSSAEPTELPGEPGSRLNGLFPMAASERVDWIMSQMLEGAREHLVDQFAYVEAAAREEAIERHLDRQRAWSLATFGPGNRTAGVIDHIRRELHEIEEQPLSLEEWIDVAILAFDGAWRAGHAPNAIAAAWLSKQAKNEARDWPDWRLADPDKAIEHLKEPK
jgi:hypothetical protein